MPKKHGLERKREMAEARKARRRSRGQGRARGASAREVAEQAGLKRDRHGRVLHTNQRARDRADAKG